MPYGAPVDDGHLLLRRFDPDNKDHFSFDEALGVKRFRSGAFRWDPDEDEPGTGAVGCSVHDDDLLAESGVPRHKVVRAPYLYVAGATALTIREVGAPSTQPFDAVEDPYPDGQDKASEIDHAHALVVRAERIKDKWLSRLALRFSVLPLERGQGA